MKPVGRTHRPGTRGTQRCIPEKTHKAPPPKKECKPIKLGGLVVAAQGTVVVTGGKHGKGKRGTQKYMPDDGWDALSADARPKPIESQKKGSA